MSEQTSPSKGTSKADQPVKPVKDAAEPRKGELSDEDLNQVAGGAAPTHKKAP